MKLEVKKALFVILLVVFVLAIFNTASFAIVNPGDYEPTFNEGEAQSIIHKGIPVLKVLRTIAAVVSIGALVVMGIKYMLGSVEQKSKYKETLLPYALGIVMVVSLTTILTFIDFIMN